MFFKRAKPTKRDWAVGLDFSASRVCGVFIRRGNAVAKLEAFDARPLNAAVGQADSIAAAAAEVAQLFDGWSVPERRAFAVVNPPGAVVCQAELPRMPLSEARAALQLNSVRYLHRDLSNHYLDLVEQTALDTQPRTANGAMLDKMQLLVGAATRAEVLWYRNVLLAAKVRPVAIELSALAIVNGLLATEPELCQNEAVLLLDLRAYTTTMNFLWQSQLRLTHGMDFGSHQISEHLANQPGWELPVAESETQKMMEPVQGCRSATISPPARELRSSIDFFDERHECRVSRAFACGGGAEAAKILKILGYEAGIHIEAWDCLKRLDTSQIRGDRTQLAVVAPELAAAVGAALARLQAGPCESDHC